MDKFRKRLSKQGATYLYNETAGAHSWENWRKYLLDFLPRIFSLLIIMTMKEIIRQALENVLPLVDLDSDFLFQELDSLGITTILMTLSDMYGIELNHSDVTPKNFRTLDSLVEMVQKKINEK